MTDQEVLNAIDQEFGPCPRPEHFTDYTHCCECSEHDALLRSRDRESLDLAGVGNQGWDPICFITPEGFAYYLPALARFALSDTDATWGWYGSQLAFHLCYTGAANVRWQYCSESQRSAIAMLLEHLIETRAQVADDEYSADVLLQAWEIWAHTVPPN